jgi:hypothetical protein
MFLTMDWLGIKIKVALAKQNKPGKLKVPDSRFTAAAAKTD